MEDTRMAWGDTGQPLAKLDHVPRDASWEKLLPENHKIISTIGYGASYWSQSGKIDVRLADGSPKSYFIKLSRTDVGKVMVEGEFESMKLLHQMSPNMVPQPIGYGTYESNDDIHFFLCEFVDLSDELPDVDDLCEGLANLHWKSMEHSPNNKFGFHVPTCNGTVQQHRSWNSSWEGFFIDVLKHSFCQEAEVQGPSDEIARLLPDLYTKVCPRLLRPLETEGRTLRPCLIHADLWDGNMAVHTRTGMPYIFDASAMWGHNELEHQKWRGERYRIGKTWRREYFRFFPISPPEDDWDDRNLLYSLMADLHDSILFKSNTRFRALIIETLKELVAKFPNGYEGSADQKADEPLREDGHDTMPAMAQDGADASGQETPRGNEEYASPIAKQEDSAEAEHNAVKTADPDEVKGTDQDGAKENDQDAAKETNFEVPEGTGQTAPETADADAASEARQDTAQLVQIDTAEEASHVVVADADRDQPQERGHRIVPEVREEAAQVVKEGEDSVDGLKATAEVNKETTQGAMQDFQVERSKTYEEPLSNPADHS